MRLIERFSIIVFSILIFVISGFTILVSTDIIGMDVLESIFNVLSDNIVSTVCIGLVMILWSIANIFFKDNSSKENSNGILLENENGSLLITKESISNLVESELRKTEDVKDYNVKIEFDSKRDLIVNVVMIVKDQTVIKEISAKVQENIKLSIKRATDLEVNQINIKIKNVEQEKKAVVQ